MKERAMKVSTIAGMIRERAGGKTAGLYSACTANAYVIEAVLEAGRDCGALTIIEATANQSNQYGGYTGMTPADFKHFVLRIAERVGFDERLLLLGGDHLGPLTWRDLPEKDAMAEAEELVRQYVAAGFGKIHLDTSMKLADDDKEARLPDGKIAARAARLAEVCEETAARAGRAPEYVIGSEVPVPGGVCEETGLCITSPDDALSTYAAFKDAFHARGLDEAFSRVVGLVVQPGVEFGDDLVIEYDPAAAAELMSVLRAPGMDGRIVFEGHSTDYQSRASLRRMVEDGIALLKVGPALTFYLREALFALADIEAELAPADPSHFKQALDGVMMSDPDHWNRYYSGSEQELRFKRKYSLSDRARYYLPDERVKAATSKLIRNIDGARVPVSLLSQYLPSALARLRNGGSAASFSAGDLIKARVKDCVDDYLYATATMTATAPETATPTASLSALSRSL
jgi:D-tagatose-1,6-bisphosphate aldolase subunit GatZ/KbaZ